MTHDELSIDLRNEDGQILVFRLRGSLDIATSPTVRAALVESTANGASDVIVDMTQLEFLDSTGLGALIGAHRRALERGGSLRLVVGPGPIARLLDITGLMRVFSVYHTLKDARESRSRVTELV